MNYYNIDELKNAFKKVAVKTVSVTDIDKGAYVVDRKQRKVLEEAGFIPGEHPDVTIVPLHVLGSNEALEASFYGSRRHGSGRLPEYRMGRFIDSIGFGDELVFATDGKDIFVCKTDSDEKITADVRGAYEETAVSLNERLELDELIKRAMQAEPKPDTHTTSTTVYNRDPSVVALARYRSDHTCEMPECDYKGFTKNNGKLYIETHHIIPRSEGGEDTVFNVAAVCPNCHKALHFAENRDKLAEELKKAVIEANENAGIKISVK